MNLPYPFNKASDVRADAQGSINLIDPQGKPLARIPLNAAFELSPESEGYGDGLGFRNGYGDGYGHYGYGYSSGYGYGYGDGYSSGYGDGDGSGESR